MKKITSLCLVFLMMLGLAACGGEAPASSSLPESAPPAESDVPDSQPLPGDGTEAEGAAFLPNDGSLPTRMTLFTCESVPRLLGGDANACYSPASLYLALALAGTGATGQTEAEMAEVLALDGDGFGGLSAEIRGLMDTLPFEADTGRLLIGNSVWLSDLYQPVPAFAENAEANFDAELHSVPFGDAATDAAIDAWILEKTAELIHAGVQTDPEASMMLINTVYFKDEWVPIIEPENNTNEPFFAADGTEPEAEYMHLSQEQQYYAGEGFTAAALEMKNGASMTFVLPDEGVDPASLVASPEGVYALLDGSESSLANVHYKIPKFTIEDTLDPVDALTAMGMPAAFGDGAEFTGLYESEVPGKISDITQQTYIAVDEKGAEAAGATVVEIAPTAAMPDPEPLPEIELYLERPFIFFLSMPQLGNAPLFIGVFAMPQ